MKLNKCHKKMSIKKYKNRILNNCMHFYISLFFCFVGARALSVFWLAVPAAAAILNSLPSCRYLVELLLLLLLCLWLINVVDFNQLEKDLKVIYLQIKTSNTKTRQTHIHTFGKQSIIYTYE